MTHAKLNTGANVPLLGFGTWQSDPGAVGTAVKVAVQAGVRHIDCAAVYRNEAEVGAALQELFSSGVVKREELFITSKLWLTEFDNVSEALSTTLSDLQLDYVDLYLIHWPTQLSKGSGFPLKPEDIHDYNPGKLLQVWRELEREQAAGRVRAIGVSNFSIRKLEELWSAAAVKPAANQVECHPYLPQTQLLEWCSRHQVLLTAYSPLGSPARPNAGASTDPVLLDEPVLHAIAGKHGATPAQVAIQWHVQRGVAVIPKSVTPSRITSNAHISFTLSEEDMQQVNALGSKDLRYVKADFLSKPGCAWQQYWDMDYTPTM